MSKITYRIEKLSNGVKKEFENYTHYDPSFYNKQCVFIVGFKDSRKFKYIDFCQDLSSIFKDELCFKRVLNRQNANCLMICNEFDSINEMEEFVELYELEKQSYKL